ARACTGGPGCSTPGRCASCSRTMTEGPRLSMVADQRGERPDRASRGPGSPPPQAVMGLLNYITATSLDEDYAEAARRQSDKGPASPGPPATTGLRLLAEF